jgi:bifunctional UDP-N-acetylglucosamine pyrophosphorylase / glucosamine-1-phosphate N-acetyltransferase
VAEPVVVIMAAGQGTRMRSTTPKLLHAICGKPMIWWTVTAAREAGASRIVVVDAAGEPLKPVLAEIDPDVQVVVQKVARGTADAVKAAVPHVDPSAPVIVLNGDVPLITATTISALTEAHVTSSAAATVLSSIFSDPSGYGRIVRDGDGSVTKIVETKKAGDATDAELEIKEINSGIYAFDGDKLPDALERVQSDNAQGEYYLPDVLGILRSDGHTVAASPLASEEETLGINDRVQLQAVVAIAQRRIHEQHMRAGATIVSPQTTVIDVNVILGQDVTILPGTNLHGVTTIADGAEIGPYSTLTDVTVGEESKVIQTVADGARIGAGVSVGPFCYLRPGTVLRDRSKAGTYVELKNTDVGEGSKVPHLSYIGDTTIGEGTNLGASTITANYDGYNKNRTTIGSHVHTAVHTTLVAPVTLGDNTWTGAGSPITKDVPDGALGVSRARQVNIEGYDEKIKGRHADD